MAYYKEKRKFRPIFTKAKEMKDNEISISPKGHLLLIFPENPQAKLECALGWENEIVTFLRLIPNPVFKEILQSTEDLTVVQEWVSKKLAILFKDTNIPIPTWELRAR